MLLEILFCHGLVSRGILSICEVLLAHFQLPLGLGDLQFFHIGCRPYWYRIKLLLIHRFIIDFIITEVEMCLPQLMLHLDVILITLNRGGTPTRIRSLVVGTMRGLLSMPDFGVSDCEMRLLDLLSNLFI